MTSGSSKNSAARTRSLGSLAPRSASREVDFNTWNTIAPRASFAYDIGGAGKTVLKGGWGRYDHVRQIDELQPANQNIANDDHVDVARSQQQP